MIIAPAVLSERSAGAALSAACDLQVWPGPRRGELRRCSSSWAARRSLPTCSFSGGYGRRLWAGWAGQGSPVRSASCAPHGCSVFLTKYSVCLTDLTSVAANRSQVLCKLACPLCILRPKTPPTSPAPAPPLSLCSISPLMTAYFVLSVLQIFPPIRQYFTALRQAATCSGAAKLCAKGWHTRLDCWLR